MIFINKADLNFECLNGVDYSEMAVELALKSNKLNEQWEQRITSVFRADLCCADFDISKFNTFDVGIDIGTYDAITLRPPDEMSETEHQQRVANFIDNVSKMVQQRLVIASCNWTMNEIEKSWGAKWMVDRVLPTPTFRFGNKEGRTVTCIVLIKKE